MLVAVEQRQVGMEEGFARRAAGQGREPRIVRRRRVAFESPGDVFHRLQRAQGEVAFEESFPGHGAYSAASVLGWHLVGRD
ncbi:MAG: hypothetical protein DMF53_16770 [Acidobacteria bacterium]|nr:MAG: hypothetical protein DMF53_16770 [Acidobacteriota bacterium]